jgi:hypothetical protein
MLRLIAAIALAASMSTSAQAQGGCSNVYRPECSKSPFAPSGQGYWAGPYGYGYDDGGPPPAYYGQGRGYYRRAPYGAYGPYAPYGYWGGPGY